MKRTVLLVLMGFLLITAPVFAQERIVTGRVTSEQGSPLAGVSVSVKGTSIATSTNDDGQYSIRAETGQVLQFRFIGTALAERTVGTEDVIDVALRRVALSLEAVVVTALGQTAAQRALGASQQTVQGTDIAQTQRENFINALQGRVAGLDVTSTSGVPGASTSITIRGVSSISGSNQPLLIVDGLPLDNKTVNTESLASDVSSNTALSNRGVDFTNRAADLNPEDIETVTVLKGPEASALYGIDAANGAIVITTKRGRTGASSFEYSNSFTMARTGARPEIQRTYGPTSLTGGLLGSFSYFGDPYPAGTTFYDNIDGFFRTAVTAHNNLVFSGVTPDSRINYRISASAVQQNGVVPNANYDRYNVTGSSRAQVKDWLTADLSMTYAYDVNDQPWKGTNGPLLGLLVWPQTDNAKDWLTPAGTRRRLTLLTAGAEIDNPYFNVARNLQNARTNRLITNLGLTVAPFSWGYLKTNLGVDGYSNELQIVRDPQSAIGVGSNGILDVGTDVTRNLSAQSILNVNPQAVTPAFSISGLVGHAVIDQKSSTDAADGVDFLDPNFVSINNTRTRLPLTTLKRRRVVSLFGSATFDYKQFLYVTVTGRNDWSSTLPPGHNSFFYPSVSTSFILSDAVPGIGRFMTAKLRAAYAEAGKDALPYSYRPALQNKTTSYGGYGYNFWGPNLNLRPEFARSVEGGVELGFLDDRIGVDITAYRKVTTDQIIQNIRGSYGTGFVLFNVNGGKTRSRGVEATLRGTPIQKRQFSWDFSANFAASGSILLSLPRDLPESYVSDTWLYGNVRAGTRPGLSTMALTGTFYLRNNQGQLLIDPTSGLPVRSADFIDAGYDRQPDYTIGLGNTLRYKRWTLDFLFDIRRGGDVFDATSHYLTVRGLTMRTLDREEPRVIPGVLRDGKENTANPTRNTIVVIPAVQPAFYTGMSEELFIERDINWMRLRDVQISYELPRAALRFLRAREASLYLRGTDLFLITNYTGLDPIVNGNTAAVGGSGGVGIDYGNFPVPRGFNFGVKVGF
ncbi:MAG TPA: SusC/RagA family TonB-linked outer membrane protein [Gemmatimonadales bacterium]|nr:SusC/RagA family TonB-linked outer membrane protein [Gemmatimonadales bacterium]